MMLSNSSADEAERPNENLQKLPEQYFTDWMIFQSSNQQCHSTEEMCCCTH